jgi:tetratricopeptide (TPR) repeat protein
VCRAVHHAHQKGVIHRDIKPSNVLVAVQDGRPTPKLIDFGIAHAMDDFEMAGTLLTERGQLIGTPEYMSPEQAAGHRDIDTRTDVYALGVLLYELLAGATPFDRASWENSGLVHLQRVIREQEPPAPSARVKGLGGKAAQIAQTRRADQASLYKKLHGDLDWIIMKALEKDRARRYGTVDAFAGDIDRYRTLEPVSARAPTRTYRLRKFARRNRAALTIGLVIVVLLVGGVVGTSIGMIRARREAQIARTESEVARAVSAFLNDDLLAAVADQATGHDVGMRKILDVASKRIEGRFQDQPAAELAIRSSLGRAYKYLGEFLLARQHLERAIALSRQANVVAPTQRIDALLLLADVCNALEEPTGAEPLLAEALPHAIVLEGDAGWYPLLIRNSLAQTYRRLHRPADAEALYRRVIDIRRGMGDAVDNQRELLTTMSNLGALYYSQDRFDEAYVIASEVHIRAGPLLGADHLITMKATFDLARLMGRRGQLTAAGELLDPLVVTMRRKLGENHPNVYFVVAALASVRRDQGRLDESLDLRLESFEGFRRAYGEANTLTQGEIGELVTLYQKLECPEDVDLWQARQIEPGS